MAELEVYRAITAITGELAKVGIAKDQKNVTQGYAFRGIDSVYRALSGLLAEHQLCVIPRVMSKEVTERTTQKGSVLIYTTLMVEYDFVSAKDGSKHTAVTIGEAMDSGDKSCNKAMSAAYKYACLQTFCIPTEGDNDTENTTHDDILPPPTAPDPLFSLPPDKHKVEKKPKRGDEERAAMAEPTAWDGKKPTEKQKKAEFEGFLAYIHKMSPGTYSLDEKLQQIRDKAAQGWFNEAQACELAIRVYAKNGVDTARILLGNCIRNKTFADDKGSVLNAVVEASIAEFKVASLNRAAILEKLGECSTLVEVDALILPLVANCSSEEADWLAAERQNAEGRLNGNV